MSEQKYVVDASARAGTAESDLSFLVVFGYHWLLVGLSTEESSSGSIEP